jgi:hypothetical protein
MTKVCFAVSETKGIVTAMAQTGAVDANERVFVRHEHAKFRL